MPVYAKPNSKDANMSSQGQNIQVFVRCRPLDKSERQSVVDVIPERREIKVLDRYASHTASDTKNFHFDQVFAPDAKQIDVYATVVRPLIDQVLLGFNCTVFAYGQTGTGKTFTMEGDRSDKSLNWEEDPYCGIIPRSVSQLFDTLKDQENEFSVRVSFLELYNEDTYDLLSAIDDTTKLKIFEDIQKKGSVIVGGLEEVIVQSKAEIYDILRRGSAKRQTAATLLNACSSRSHTIFSVTVHIKEGSIEGEELLKIGKLNLVDLAGSENIGRSGAQDKRAREAGNINQSLLTLGRVITALVEKRPHVPYRESKLTRLLQDSLGGKTKTSIIATISPSVPDLEDTLSTLDYASRAKKITNKPEMNQRLTKKALLREYTQEIERLRRDLQATREKNGVYIDEENYKEMCKQLSAGNAAIKEKEDRLTMLQDEIGKGQKLFEEFTFKFEQTKAELDRAMENCEEQKRLIEAQHETEKKLTTQASALLQVAETATNDNNLLHNKKERIENILRENRANIQRFHPVLKDDVGRLETSVQFLSTEYVNGFDSFLEKSWTDINSLKEVVDQMTEANKLMAEKHDAQSANYKRISNDLKIQSDNCSKQAEHYESLAKETRALSNDLMTQRDDYLALAREHESQALSLRNGGPVAEEINKTISNFKTNSKMDADNLKQTLSTLNSTVKREFGTLRHKLDRIFTREIKEDVKTGSTPQRRNYDIPKRLIRTSDCGVITEK